MLTCTNLIKVIKKFNWQWLVRTIIINHKQTFGQTTFKLWPAHISWATIVELVREKWHLRISHGKERHSARFRKFPDFFSNAKSGHWHIKLMKLSKGMSLHLLLLLITYTKEKKKSTTEHCTWAKKSKRTFNTQPKTSRKNAKLWGHLCENWPKQP